MEEEREEEKRREWLLAICSVFNLPGRSMLCNAMRGWPMLGWFLAWLGLYCLCLARACLSAMLC